MVATFNVFGTANHARAKFSIFHDPDTPDVSNHVLNADARPKRRIVATLPSQQQSGDEITPRRCIYHVSLGIPFTHELPPRFKENEYVPPI